MAREYLGSTDALTKALVLRTFLTTSCAGGFNALFSGDGYTYTGACESRATSRPAWPQRSAHCPHSGPAFAVPPATPRVRVLFGLALPPTANAGNGGFLGATGSELHTGEVLTQAMPRVFPRIRVVFFW
jgi:hypothetical protein